MTKKSELTVLRIRKDKAGNYGATCEYSGGRILGIGASEIEAVKAAEYQRKFRR